MIYLGQKLHGVFRSGSSQKGSISLIDAKDLVSFITVFWHKALLYSLIIIIIIISTLQ